MAITKLTNTQIQTVVNEAYRQFTGTDDVSTVLDLSAFTDDGVKDVGALRSQFTGKLLGVLTKNFFTDSSYMSEYTDVFYEDENRFGAIIQNISVTIPDAKENSAWQNFVSGTTKVGQYDIYIPVVDTKYYTKSTSWEIPITITGEQWDTAFRSEGELGAFVEYLFMCLQNKIMEHRENMNSSNRNNFIAEKLHTQNTVGHTGLHAVNLVQSYCDDRGIETSMSVSDFMKSKDALKYAIEQIKLYMGYMRKQSIMFNVDGKVRFTPRDRMVVQLLTAFEERLYNVAESDTFHDDLIALPLHDSVASWQSLGDLSFDGVSSINIKDASGDTIEQSGIVGLICDKWAILHTIRKQRIGHQRFDVEDLDLYAHQFRDSYMNDMSMNGLVLYVDDVVVE